MGEKWKQCQISFSWAPRSLQMVTTAIKLKDACSLEGASLVAQLVKNLPAMQETPVQFLGREDPLEKGKSIHSSILGLPRWLSW